MTETARLLLRRFVFVASLVCAGCSSCRQDPRLSDAAYRDAVTAFHTGLAAMQTSQEVLARQEFDRVVTLAPQEPAGWANLGLLFLRQQEIDQASERLTRAAALAPRNGAIRRLQALTESRKGNLAEAIAHWRRALELDPDDGKAAYALAQEIERQGSAVSDAEAQQILERFLARHENLAARLEYARLAAKRGDGAALTRALAPVGELSKTWSPQAQEQWALLQKAASENPRAAATRVAFLKNVLLREPTYRASLAEVKTPNDEVGQPLTRLLALKNPDPQPAPVDEGLTFAVGTIAGCKGAAETADATTWIGTMSLDGDRSPVVVSADVASVCVDGQQVTKAGAARIASSADSVAAADLDYDFRTDLAIAGPGGVRLLRQQDGRFVDVTEAAKLPAAIRTAPAYGIWPADIDTDGDLDLVLAPRDGAPIVLRNNGDGTFEPREPFASGGFQRARGFAWADVDGEGVPDAAFIDEAGAVHLFLNQRGGLFRAAPVPAGYGQAVAIAAAEITGDSLFDLIVLARDGSVSRISRRANESGPSWDVTVFAKVLPVPPGLEPGTARLVAGDLDNNGAIDFIASGTTSARVLLGGPDRSFTRMTEPIAIGVRAVADLDGDGRLDLVGLQNGTTPARVTSRGAKTYHWQTLRTRAATATGDQRINSFGIGGAVEVRTGLHVQQQPIASPLVHFGLGDAAHAEVVRITWPNGVLQSEFDTQAGAIVKADQRLKGSCPWLFAWNGREMTFVTDVLWRSPLGLRINAQATADASMTEDWVKVRGDQLTPRDGTYDLRITAELWETHFFDFVSLLIVDHPKDVEVFVDERFVVPPPALRVVPTGLVQPFASVRDDAGRDVSEIVRTRDSRHLDFAGRGAYQGVTRPHFVEIAIPDEAPRRGPLYLIGQGWVHPTDSSINIAMSQGTHAAPEGLSLQIADDQGRFRTVRGGLGFPAGKDKTVLIDLTGLLPTRGARRVRLATNLEVFWDRLGWAVGRPDVKLEPRRLDLQSAELQFRGYSITEQPNASTPERPRYALAGTAPRWRDLEGYYTRFGDVRALLTGGAQPDDRYVIMNAGDELRLRFPDAGPIASGLTRDFVFISDGWEKDGDYNTSFSRTVLPLPTHRSGRYDTPPRTLEEDPIYVRHTRDFADYHTRYVAGDATRDALREPAPASTSPVRTTTRAEGTPQ